MFTSTSNTYSETRHTHNTNIHTSDFSLWTKSASPCRELLPETRIRKEDEEWDLRRERFRARNNAVNGEENINRE